MSDWLTSKPNLEGYDPSGLDRLAARVSPVLVVPNYQPFDFYPEIWCGRLLAAGGVGVRSEVLWTAADLPRRALLEVTIWLGALTAATTCHFVRGPFTFGGGAFTVHNTFFTDMRYGQSPRFFSSQNVGAGNGGTVMSVDIRVPAATVVGPFGPFYLGPSNVADDRVLIARPAADNLEFVCTSRVRLLVAA